MEDIMFTIQHWRGSFSFILYSHFFFVVFSFFIFFLQRRSSIFTFKWMDYFLFSTNLHYYFLLMCILFSLDFLFFGFFNLHLLFQRPNRRRRPIDQALDDSFVLASSLLWYSLWYTCLFGSSLLDFSLDFFSFSWNQPSSTVLQVNNSFQA